jgi:hypothetical protein
MGKVLIVVRFPNGTHSVDRLPPGRDVKVGDEIIPRWFVSRISLNEQLVDGLAVQLEVWVEPVKPDQFDTR